MFSEEQRDECKKLEMTPHGYLKMLAQKAADEVAAALMEEEIPAQAKGLSVHRTLADAARGTTLGEAITDHDHAMEKNENEKKQVSFEL